MHRDRIGKFAESRLVKNLSRLVGVSVDEARFYLDDAVLHFYAFFAVVVEGKFAVIFLCVGK